MRTPANELGRVALREVEDLQIRLVQLAGRKQAQVRKDRRPAPVGHLEAEELDGEDITKLRAPHVDGPGQGVDRVEIEREKVLGRRVPYDLPAREIVGLDNDDVA